MCVCVCMCVCLCVCVCVCGCVQENMPYNSVQGHVRNNASVCTSGSQHEFMYYVHSGLKP